MDKVRYLIREMHRRSVWQVLGVFGAASWGVLQVVEVITETVGLPDWTPSMAFVALLLGLPMVLATAIIQEGLPGSDASASGGAHPADSADPVSTPVSAAASGPAGSPASTSGSVPASSASDLPTRANLFTWRNALLGGLGAFTLLGMSLVAYFVMWTTGIGPMGSLSAQGVFSEGEPIILADFTNRSNDETLDEVVTETLRVDLASSQVITLVPKARVGDVLQLMQRDAMEPLTPALAREVAIRDGIKAVVEGEVGAAGSGYILVATLTEAQTGTPIATFRRTAAGPGEVIEAIDGLSQDIREKAGESLRTIKGEAPLQYVTTSSIEALRNFTEAELLTDQGEYQQARSLLIEAVELDPGFAMAWRKLSVVLQSAPGGPWTRAETATRAYELRDRLTELERGNAVAWYHKQVTGDQIAEMDAYELLLSSYPDDSPALNNLSIAYTDRTRHEDGIELLERAVGGPGVSSPAYVNLVAYYGYLGRVEDGWRAYERMMERYPARDTWPVWDRWYLQMVGGAWSAAVETAEEMRVSEGGPLWRSVGAWMSGLALASIGSVADGLEVIEDDYALAVADGRAHEAMWQRQFSAWILSLTVGPEAARPALSGFITSGGYEAVGLGDRDWTTMVRLLSGLGLTSEAREVLALWDRDLGPLAGSGLREARRMVEAAELDDPAEAADALVTLRTEMNCPRCFDWWIAELREEAGDLEAAAERYEGAMSVASDEKNLLPLMRVVGHERLGRIYAELGDAARSAEHYAAFATTWAGADPQFQPRVRAAAEAAGRR